MDEVEKIFCGTWLYDRDENLRKSMEDITLLCENQPLAFATSMDPTGSSGSMLVANAKEMPKEDIEFLITTRPTMTIVRKGNQIFHSTELMKGLVHDITFELGKEFETKDTKSESPLYHNKETVTYENGKLTYECRSQLTGPRKIDSVTVLYVKDGELISDTSPLNDRSIVGKRIYKKA